MESVAVKQLASGVVGIAIALAIQEIYKVSTTRAERGEAGSKLVALCVFVAGSVVAWATPWRSIRIAAQLALIAVIPMVFNNEQSAARYFDDPRVLVAAGIGAFVALSPIVMKPTVAPVGFILLLLVMLVAILASKQARHRDTKPLEHGLAGYMLAAAYMMVLTRYAKSSSDYLDLMVQQSWAFIVTFSAATQLALAD
jgi:hypothetical protein